jgi:hypothetical protein
MSVYRFCWGGLVLPLAGLGMVVAVLALPPGDVLLRVGVGLVIGPAASMLVHELLEACDMAPRPACAAVAGAISLVAAAGVRVALGEGAMLLLAVLVVLTSPAVLRCCAVVVRARLLLVLTRASSGQMPPPSILARPLLATLAVRQLSDEELAAAWRHSCRALQQAVDPDRRLGWVYARQVYLEELERRCPERLASWFALGVVPTSQSLHLPPPGRSDLDPA